MLSFKDAAMKLVLGERKSFMPLTYSLITIMAYFGPNSHLLGNIKLEMWHYEKPIADIQAYVSKVSLLMIADWLSFFLNGILLWHYCKINVFKIMKKLQEEFWLVFAMVEALLLMEVSCNFTVLHTIITIATHTCVIF